MYDDQRLGHRGTQRPADNLPAEKVDHHGKIPPPLLGGDAGDVTGPDPIRLAGLKIAVEPAIRNRQAVVALYFLQDRTRTEFSRCSTTRPRRGWRRTAFRSGQLPASSAIPTPGWSRSTMPIITRIIKKPQHKRSVSDWPNWSLHPTRGKDRKSMSAKSLERMVGVTGIEPVTPTMST